MGSGIDSVVKPLRWMGISDAPRATKGAISMARARLGVCPLTHTFHNLCQPIITFSVFIERR